MPLPVSLRLEQTVAKVHSLSAAKSPAIRDGKFKEPWRVMSEVVVMASVDRRQRTQVCINRLVIVRLGHRASFLTD